MKALGDASGIIRSFIEDYHEKLEEDYIFPRFEKANRQVDLVKTLKAQHDAGRRITSRIRSIAGSATFDGQTRSELTTLISEFIRMYRPHAAREDTVLFREFPDVVGSSEYKKLGEIFEDREHKLFGENGFVKTVDKVAAIERDLGIYGLFQFTPKQ
jgi:hemerythrin-like domain-containing protein